MNKSLASTIRNAFTHSGDAICSGILPRVILVLFLSLNLSACYSLPVEPHTANSLHLNTALQNLYSTTHLDNAVTQSVDAQSQDSHNDNTLDDDANNNDARDDTQSQQLSHAIAEQEKRHPNASGYHTIITGANAFAGRSILTDMADKSIDVQYYIWHNDQAGQLLLQDLWQAAERGVIVRFLLDDFNNDAKLDQHLLRFASHPNIAVRLINPMAHRKFQALNYITDLKRINHRMHNKSMTFDRQISIIGGRNIGDEYLSNDEASQFADLDVLLIGPVVRDITNSFESFWQSPFSFDVETLVDSSDNSSLSDVNFVETLDKLYSTHQDSTSQDSNNQGSNNQSNVLSVYKQAVQTSTIGTDLIQQKVPFRWTDMTFLSDEVGKLTNSASLNSHLVNQLRATFGHPREKLTIISSYFVPTKDGVNSLIKLANEGVKVKILTNSFKATDVAAVHSGYAQWRVSLLKAGIELYELKAIASEEDRDNKLWRARSQSSTSLHAKTFAVDDNHVFIGSYNVDPRSANINTEMGVVINDKDLAARLHAAVSDNLLDLSYKVTLTDNETLQWQTLENAKLVAYDSEPDVDTTDKIWIKIMSLLPIDWLL